MQRGLPLWRLLPGAALLCLCASALHAAAPSQRPLADLLRELSRPGQQFLFSSELVPDDLRVPEAGLTDAPTLTKLQALLTPLGLALERVDTGVYAVVRSAPPPPPPPPPRPQRLDELVVTASRYRFESETAGSVATLTAERLAAQPGVGDDPLRAIARLPGVVADGVSAQGNVRGGETGETLVLLDGFPLRRAFHMASYQSPFSVIDAQLLRSAEIFTGGFPARYGNRMAAVYDLQTVTARDAPRNHLGVDFFNAGGHTTGSTQDGGLEWLADARIGTLSPLLQALAPDVGDPRYTDGMLRVAGGDPRTLRVALNALWSRDELAITERRRGESARIGERARYFWLRADRDFGSQWNASLWIGRTDLDSRREGRLDHAGIARGSVLDQRASQLQDVRAQATWQPDDRHRLELGAEYTRESARYEYAGNAAYSTQVARLLQIDEALQREALLRPERDRGAAFASLHWRLTPSLTAETGLRGQIVAGRGRAGRVYADPRLGLRWQVTPHTRLHFNWGRYHQADEVQEIEVGDGMTDFARTQRSEHFILGLRHQFAPALALRLEAYSKQQAQPRVRFENLFNRRSILAEIGPDRIALLPDYAELMGLEASLEYQASEWEAWAGVDWSRALDEVGERDVPRSWDQGLGVDAGAMWRRGPWRLSATLNLHRGLPTTRLVQTATGVALDARNRARLPRFLELNLRADYEQPLRLGVLRYSAELNNALAQRNDCCTDLVLEQGAFRLRPLGGLPLMPSLGIRWSW